MADLILDEDFFPDGSGAPVPSWDTLGVGGVQGGVILPQVHPKTGITVAYLTTQQTSMATSDKPSEALWYDNDPSGSTYRTRPRKQCEFTVQTKVRDFSDCSDNKKEFAATNEEVDDGIRRIIVKGKTATDSFFKASRATFGVKGRPEIGASIFLKLDGRRKSGDFKENVISVKFVAKSPETLAVVQAYMETAMSDISTFSDAPAEPSSPKSTSGNDPWAEVGTEKAPIPF